MNIAIIVLNYKKYIDTIICVDKLISIGVEAEIVIVDNASPNDSYTLLKEKYDKESNVSVILSDKNGGYSAGNNLGVKYALDNFNPDTIAIMNPDIIIPDKSVITNLYNLLNGNDEYGVIGGVPITNNKFDLSKCCWNIPKGIEVVKSHFIKRNSGGNVKSCNFLGNALIQTECVAGCFFMIKSHIFKKVGFFDENVFLYNEENILGINIKKYGYKEVVSLNDFYYHNHDYTINETTTFLNKVMATKNTFESRKYMCLKYYDKWLLPLLYFVEFLNRAYLACCFIWNKFFRR